MVTGYNDNNNNTNNNSDDNNNNDNITSNRDGRCAAPTLSQNIIRCQLHTANVFYFSFTIPSVRSYYYYYSIK